MKALVALRILATFLIGVSPARCGLAAEIVTLDFQGLVPMPSAAGSPVPLASQLSNQFLASHGVLFQSASASPFVAVVDLGGGGVGIAGADDNHNLSYGTLVRARFFLPAQPSVPAATDFVSIRPAVGSPLGIAYAITAFDLAGTYLTGDFNTTLVGVPVNVGWGGVEIHSVEIFGSIAFDDFSFGAPLTAVPEPAAAGLIAMVAVVAVVKRRCRVC